MRSRTIPSVLLACIIVSASICVANTVDISPQENKTDRQARQNLVIKFQPRPDFPDHLRKQKIDATVTLRAIFSATGQVTGVKFFGIDPLDLPEEVVKDLANRCKAAARKIEFEPAKRDGRFVSMWVELQYNFRVDDRSAKLQPELSHPQ